MWNYRLYSVYSTLLFVMLISTSFSQTKGQTIPSCNGTDCHPAATNFLSLLNNFRTLSVTNTCGEGGPTLYQKHPLTFDTTNYTCNAGDHRMSYIADRQIQTLDSMTFDIPITETYWQSKSSILTKGGEAQRICVTVNLTDTFLFRRLKAFFLAPKIASDSKLFDMRPEAMVIEVYGNSQPPKWSPVRYYAKNCATSFPGIPIRSTGADLPATSASCRQLYYSGHEATQISVGKGLQEVKFNPASSIELGDKYHSDILVQKHYQMSAIRLCMIQPAFADPLQSYYVIADWEVDGHCFCYGHSNECTGPNAAQCKCSHNTMGNNCEKCLPLFNNKPWRIGANHQANECEDCGCNGRAESCHYDAAKGYGICDSCSAKSTGDKCQFCITQYYVNPQNASNFTVGQTCEGFNGTAVMTYNCSDYCIPCNCSQTGSLASSSYSCQNTTGQCSCKPNVFGRRCDTCKDQFWNLNKDNPNGCQACDCVAAGTSGNTKLCNKITGQCVCKNNTQGTKCDQCKPGFFDFTVSNPEGCQKCDCDFGASTSSTCPVSGGQCFCRSQISGRTCRSPNPQFYVPFLDDLTFEPEYTPSAKQFGVIEKPGHGEINSTLTGHGFLNLNGSSKMIMTIQAPKTATYNLILRYETNATATISMQITPPTGVDLSSCGSALLPSSTANLAEARSRGAAIISTICMIANGKYSMDLSVTTAPTPLLLDSVVLLPVITGMPEYQNANSDTKVTIDSCFQEAQKAGPRPQCNPTEFSLMAAFMNGASQCSCNVTGSTSQTCAGTGGQCPCAPGVMLKDCSRCKVNHYGFSNAGCKACNCDEKGSVRLSCNDTGDCECKPNVIGKACSSCKQEHYGLFTGNGCIPCNCNMTYSFNNMCQDSGQCYCKPGVGGRTCNECLDNFYRLTATGCTSCNCNNIGSFNTTCAKDTGQCQCRTKVNGTKCEKCAEGYYGLGTWTDDGCLPCFCSGHSANCTSANGWYLATTFYDWSLYSSDQALSDQWSGVDDKGNDVQVVKGSVAGKGAQFVMQLVNDGPNVALNQFYFKAKKDFLGDRRGAYATNFTFELSLTYPAPFVEPATAANTTTTTNITTNSTSGNNNSSAPANPVPVSDPKYVDSTLGDVIISGAHTSFKLVASIKGRPAATRSAFAISMTEKEWRKDNLATGTYPTYQEIMMLLSNITEVLVRAKYSSAIGARTSLFSVRMIYTSQSPFSLQPVNKMEQCVCPTGYAGQFCERCAPGYTRETPGGGPYSKCIPCKCNNHGDKGMPCDPESGACNCVNNTEGVNCEKCKIGFYGNATVGMPEDCKPCLCPGNVVNKDINAFASSCIMLDDGRHQCTNCSKGHEGRMCDICSNTYYGQPTNISMNMGKCLPCQCNGRADTCNSTSGECLNCRNNTAGPNCNICAPKFFGNAMINRCLTCDCNMPGATGDCDHQSGKCVCKENVEGFRCERCARNSYNYSASGCANCSCHPLGALGQSCNVTSGQCLCRSHVTGRACDKCDDTYWNIHSTGCEPCRCTPIGTANITGQTFGKCNLTTGQCTCITEAIIGRTCDTCAKGTKEKYTFIQGKYIGRYPTCKICGECFDNWGKKIDKAGLDNQDLYRRAMAVWTNYSNKTAEQVIPVINGTQKDLNNIAASVNKSIGMLNNLTGIQTGYDDLMAKAKLQLNLTLRLENTYKATNLNVTTAQAFSGYFILRGLSLTPNMMSTLVKSYKDRYDFYAKTRNDAWASISLATNLISNTSNMVQSLVSKVTLAKTKLDSALLDETSAKVILKNDKPALLTNDIVLQNATKVAQNSPGVLNGIAQSLNGTNDLISNVNGTLTNSEAIVINKRDQIQAMVDLAQVTKANLTLAKTTTDEALGKLNKYVQTANDTKNNATSVFQGIMVHLDSLKNVTTMIDQSDSFIKNITTTTLRPLAELKVVTDNIKSFSLTKGVVDATFSRASKAQAVVIQASNEATSVLETSQRTLEQVKAVMYNLNVTRSKSGQLLGNMNSFIGSNSSIASVVDGVNLKSQNANTQSGLVVNAIKDTDRYMTTLEANINEKKVRMAAAGDAVKRMASLVENAKVIQQGSTVILANVTARASTGLGLSGQNYNDLLTGQSDLKQVTSRLDKDIGGIKAIEELFAQIDIQRSRMQYLDSEVNGLNIQMDQLLKELDNFTPLPIL